MMPMMAEYLRLTRAHNCLAGSLAVLLGAHLNGRGLDEPRLLLRAALIVGLVIAAGNVVNDLRDLEVDRLDKPGRPLPSGAIPPRSARLLASALVISSVWLIVGLPTPLIVFALAALALGLTYSLYLKSTLAVGNIVVAALSAATIVFGGLAVGPLQAPVVAATVIVFVFLLGREILKDVADHDGDTTMRITTLSTRFGREASMRLVGVIMSLFVVLANLPFVLGMGDLWYLATIWPLALLPTLVSVVRVRAAPSPGNIDRALRLTKFAWFGGLAAMVLLR